MVALYRAWIGKPISDAKALESMARTAAEMTASAGREIERVRADAELSIRSVQAQAAERLSIALQDVNEARRQASQARAAAESTERICGMWYRQMTTEAYRPSATVERWRELVTQFPPNVGVNGSSVH